jgi:cold shock CspA family protein
VGEFSAQMKDDDVHKGYVRLIFHEKAYGFITDGKSGEEWFFHRNSLLNKNAFSNLVLTMHKR